MEAAKSAPSSFAPQSPVGLRGFEEGEGLADLHLDRAVRDRLEEALCGGARLYQET